MNIKLTKEDGSIIPFYDVEKMIIDQTEIKIYQKKGFHYFSPDEIRRHAIFSGEE